MESSELILKELREINANISRLVTIMTNNQVSGIRKHDTQVQDRIKKARAELDEKIAGLK